MKSMFAGLVLSLSLSVAFAISGCASSATATKPQPITAPSPKNRPLPSNQAIQRTYRVENSTRTPTPDGYVDVGFMDVSLVPGPFIDKNILVYWHITDADNSFKRIHETYNTNEFVATPAAGFEPDIQTVKESYEMRVYIVWNPKADAKNAFRYTATWITVENTNTES